MPHVKKTYALTAGIILTSALIISGGVFGIIKQAAATGVGVGNTNFSMVAGENVYFGQTSAANSAGNFLLFERGAGNVVFRIDHVGNITTTGQVLGSNTFWGLNGSNLYASSTAWNVGIGATNPNDKLSVKQASNYGYASTTNNALAVYADNSAFKKIYFGFDTSLGAYGSGYIQAEYQGTARLPLLLNANGGNVGIGTTNPLAKLQIVGDLVAPTVFANTDYGQLHISNTAAVASRFSKITFGNPYASNSATAAIGVDFEGSGTFMSFGTSNSYPGVTNTAMTINPSGNVGIGTAAPGTKLSVNAGAGNAIHAGGGQVSVNLTPVNNDHATSKLYVDNNFAPIGGVSKWLDGAAGSIYRSSNVGIGTTAPNQKLEVQGTAMIQTPATAGYAVIFSNGNGPVYSGNGDLQFYSNNVAYSTRFFSANRATELVTLLNSGNLGLNITAPSTRLQIYSNDVPEIASANPLGAFSIKSSASTAMVMGVNPSYPYEGWIQVRHGTVAGGNYYPLSLQTLGGGVGIGPINPREKIDIEGALRVGSDGKLTAYSVSGGGCPGCGTETVALQTTIDSRTVGDGLPFDNENRHVLALQPSFGYVGIGTTSPTYKFHLSSGTTPAFRIDGSSANYYFQVSQYADTYIKSSNNSTPLLTVEGTGTADLLNLKDNGTTIFTVRDGGNVGIGTTAPGTKLSVNAGAGNAIHAGGGQVSVNLTPVNNDHATSKLYVDNNFAPIGGVSKWLDGAAGSIYRSSNVGIGTTAPVSSLDLRRLISTPAQGSDWIEFSLGSSEYAERRAAISAYRSNVGADVDNIGLAFKTHASNSHLDAPITKMVIDYNGNVGIGVTNPSALLDVRDGHLYVGSETFANPGSWASTINLDGSSHARILIEERSTGVQTALWAHTGGNAKVGTVSSHNFGIISGGAERMTFTTGGNVGIGTTNPGYSLDVNGTLNIAGANPIRLSGWWFANYDSTTGGANGTFKYGASQDIDANFVNGGASRLYIDASSGNVGIGTTGPGAKLEVNGSIIAGGGSSSNWATGNFGGSKSINASGSIYSYNSMCVGNSSGSCDSSGGVVLGKSFGTVSLTTGISYFNGGNVGIGTTTPGTKLTFVAGTGNQINVAGGQVAGLNSTPVNTDHAVPLGYLQANYSPTAGSLWKGTLNGNIWNGDSGAGNVGIGTTNPNNGKLVVLGSGAGVPVLDIAYTISTDNYGVGLRASGGANNSRLRLGSATGEVELYSGDNVAHVLKINNYTTTKIQLHSNDVSYFNGGNVGVGTTAPGLKTETMGTYALPATSGTAQNGSLRISSSGGTAVIDMGLGDLKGWIQTTYSNNLASNLPLLLNPNGGTVGLGTTAPNSAYKLHVVGDSYVSGDLTVDGGDIINGNVSVDIGEAYTAGALFSESTDNSYFDIYCADSGGNDLCEFKTGIYNNGSTFYNQNNLVQRGPISNDSATYLTINGGTSNHTYFASNVGIGTTTMNDKLQVAGNTYISGNLSVGGNVTAPYNNGYNGQDLTITAGGSSSGTGGDLSLLAGCSTEGCGNIEIKNESGGGTISLKNSSGQIFINSSGNVGIGKTNPAVRLDVNGAASFSGNIRGSQIISNANGFCIEDACITSWPSGVGTTMSAANISSASFGSYFGSSPGNYYFSVNSNVGVGTTNPATQFEVSGPLGGVTLTRTSDTVADEPFFLLRKGVTPSSLAQIRGIHGGGLRFTNGTSATEWARFNSSGYLGIGTTNPQQLLTVGSAGSAANSVYNVGANRMAVNSSFYSYDYICAGNDAGSCDSTNGVVIRGGSTPNSSATVSFSRGISFFNGGNVGIGTTSPTDKLHVSGGLTVTGKINASSVDPPYTINGQKYATYMAAMVGMKEETTGLLTLNCVNKVCREKINFRKQSEGSDLWLFAKTTDLEKNFSGLTVLLSKNFSGELWYEKDENNKILNIIARPDKNQRSVEVSYRLTAPRFDYQDYGNLRLDSDYEGFNLDELIK